MELHYSPTQGRRFIAKNDLESGTILLHEEPYVFLPLLPSRITNFTCLNCLTIGFSSKPHPRCESCHEHYCNSECQETYKDFHANSGECDALRCCVPFKTQLSSDDFNHFRVIVAIGARIKKENITEEMLRFKANVGSSLISIDSENVISPSTAQSLESVITNADSFPKMDGNISSFPPFIKHLKPTVSSLAILSTNESLFPEDQIEVFRELARYYIQLQVEYPTLFAKLSTLMLVRLLCAFQCNGFAKWTDPKHDIAFGFYGIASMFNHSCDPNVARRMDVDGSSRRIEIYVCQPVKKGEQLFLSYLDASLPPNLRRWRLSNQYFFNCKCIRCSEL